MRTPGLGDDRGLFPAPFEPCCDVSVPRQQHKQPAPRAGTQSKCLPVSPSLLLTQLCSTSVHCQACGQPGQHCRAAMGALVLQPPSANAAGLCVAVDKEPPSHPHPPICRATLRGACRTGGPSVLPSTWWDTEGLGGTRCLQSPPVAGYPHSHGEHTYQQSHQHRAGDRGAPGRGVTALLVLEKTSGCPVQPFHGHCQDVSNLALCTCTDGERAPLGTLHQILSPLTGKCHPHSPTSLLLLLKTLLKALLHLSHPWVQSR